MAAYKELQEQLEIHRQEVSRLEKKIEMIEDSPIKDTDVIVKCTGFMGMQYAVSKVTNMEREEVKKLLKKLTEEDMEAWDGNLESFLKEYGAEVITIMDTDSKGNGGVPFYDLEYDLDTNWVYDSRDLSAMEQTQNLINRLEFGGVLFSDTEQNLLLQYASELGDMAGIFVQVEKLREAIQSQNNRTSFQLVKKIREEIDLFTDKYDLFGIYQLKSGEELHYHRFEPLDRLNAFGRAVEKKNYELIYTAALKESQSLDDIYEEFNLYHPKDFKGHSLSVSDVILIHKNGENHAHYVDSFGFQEVPQFLEQIKEKSYVINQDKSYIDHFYVVKDLEKKGPLEIKPYQNMEEALQEYFRLPNEKLKALGLQNSQPMPGTLDFIQCKNGVDTLIKDYEISKGWNNPEIRNVVKMVEEALETHDIQIAYQVGDWYLSVQSAEEGYDYTMYDGTYRELDGGVYDNPFASVSHAVEEILGDQVMGFADCKVISYEGLMEQVESRNRITPEQAKRLEEGRPSILERIERGKQEVPEEKKMESRQKRNVKNKDAVLE